MKAPPTTYEFARLAALIVLSALASASASASSFDPFAGPKPIAVLIEQDPWRMVIGSDTPRVVVYENGDVIFARRTGKSVAHQYIKLAPPDLKAIENLWSAIFGATNLRLHYNLSSWPHMPTTFLYLRRGDQSVVAGAYGLNCLNTRKLDADKDAPPKAMLDAVERLCQLDLPASAAWTPKYIEVMLWDFSYAKEPSVRWPNEWPSLKSQRAFERGDAYSIFLDGSELPKLKAFFATLKQSTAIELDGKKWAASFRYTFPSEPDWYDAFAGPDEKE